MNGENLQRAAAETPEEELERLRAENKSQKEEIARLKDEVRHLEQLSTYDGLTGILNRRGATEEMELLMADAEAEKGGGRKHEEIPAREMSFLLLDIDDFKKINDTLGHEAGDAALKATADFLKHTFRKYDIVSRWGGEEFLVAFQGSEQDVVNKFFDKRAMMPRVSLDVQTKEGPIKITLSGGVTDYRGGENLERAIKRADGALYKSKENGKDRITKYEEPEKE